MIINFTSTAPKSIFFLLLLAFSQTAFSQSKDSIKVHEALKATANIHINNNGISLFPNLSLGRPAAILNLSVGKKGVFFEPELRWGLNGKPWSYIYWFRYKYKKSANFGLNVGVHPSYIIRESPVVINGNSENRYISQRYFSGEIAPTYYFSKKFNLGLYYLHSWGLDPYGIKSSHFFSIQPKFPNITLSKKYYASFYPHVFYLVLGDKKGTYFSETLFLSKQNCPVNISSIFTYKINSMIPGDKVVWNVGFNIKL